MLFLQIIWKNDGKWWLTIGFNSAPFSDKPISPQIPMRFFQRVAPENPVDFCGSFTLLWQGAQNFCFYSHEDGWTRNVERKRNIFNITFTWCILSEIRIYNQHVVKISLDLDCSPKVKWYRPQVEICWRLLQPKEKQSWLLGPPAVKNSSWATRQVVKAVALLPPGRATPKVGTYNDLIPTHSES